jgi:hypothetical protein
MKRLIGSLLVLCVVASASFGAILDEYAWVGTNGNFTDLTWTCNQSGAPAIPYESANTTDWVRYARPFVSNGYDVLVNTDLAPTDLGFTQFQIKKGTVTVDAGGELRIHTGYLHASTSTQASGLIVQNGGRYINTATGTGNQAGTLINYTTSLARGFVTVSGDGTLFQTHYLYSSRYGQTQTNYSTFNVLGSGSTINTEVVGPGGNNKTMTYHFQTDALGVSEINVGTSLAFKQGVTVTHVNNIAILDFVLGAAPAANYTLFDLEADATRTGLLQLVNGRVLQEQHLLRTLWEGAEYFYAISYVGGDTGNDITLSLVPEPATLGLLSLGGLFFARRRRA